MPRFTLSKHAESEMIRRQIPRAWVESVLDSPEQRYPEPDGTDILQSRFVAENGRMYLLRVILAPDKDPPVVVTLYRTSKIEKYWRPE